MSLPPLATIDDVELRVGGDVDDMDRIESLLSYASAVVRRYTGCTFVDADGALLDPLPDGVTGVVVGMIERTLDNPSGATQSTTGPFTDSFGADAAQRVYLTGMDRVILDGLRCRGGLWTQPTTRGPIETRSVYVPAGVDPLLAEG